MCNSESVIKFNNNNNNTQPANTVPKFIHIKKHNPESMMKFKTELMKLDIYNNLNKDVFADPNENYNLLEEIITDTMNKSIPTVRLGVQLKKLFKKQQLVVSFLTILKLMETL